MCRCSSGWSGVFEGISIALVGPAPPPLGGMAAQRAQLVAGLGNGGARVAEVITNPPPPAWLARLRGVRAAARLMPYCARLWAAAGQVDLVHVMANSGWAWHLMAAPAVWVARRRDVPVVVSYHGGLAGEFLARQARWVRPSLRAAAACVVPSGFLQAVFAQHGVATEIIPDSLNLARFAQAPERRRGAHIVFTRHLEPVYDPGCALEAFARVRAARPDAQLTLAGAGVLAAQLRAQAAALGVANAVRFAGALRAEEIAQLLARADVLINPSRADNMPNSVLEALAAGVPVVASRVGGVPYMVEDEVSALLAPPGDAAAFSSAVLRVINSPALASRLIEQGWQIAARHDWREVGPRWAVLYRRVLAAHAAGRGR